MPLLHNDHQEGLVLGWYFYALSNVEVAVPLIVEKGVSILPASDDRIGTRQRVNDLVVVVNQVMLAVLPDLAGPGLPVEGDDLSPTVLDLNVVTPCKRISRHSRCDPERQDLGDMRSPVIGCSSLSEPLPLKPTKPIMNRKGWARGVS